MPDRKKNTSVETIWRFPKFTPVELYQIRMGSGVTITQAEAYTGLSQQTIRRIEAGHEVNQAHMNFYQLMMERLYALNDGYLPSYRKIGESTFEDRDEQGAL